MNKEKCDNCKFFVADLDENEEYESGDCRRFPVKEYVEYTNWCGEYKFNEIEYEETE